MDKKVIVSKFEGVVSVLVGNSSPILLSLAEAEILLVDIAKCISTIRQDGYQNPKFFPANLMHSLLKKFK